MDPLFPELPEDLTALSDDDLAQLLQEHEVAADLIDANDEEFTKGIEADELLAEYQRGVEQIESIQAEQDARVEAQKAFEAAKEELAKRRKAKNEEEAEEAASEDEAEAGEAEVLAEEGEGDDDGDADDEEEEGEAEVAAADEQEEVLVASNAGNGRPRLRRPPVPSAERTPKNDKKAMLVAAAGVEGMRSGSAFSDRMSLAQAYKDTAARWGRVSKHAGGQQQRILIATANFDFPEERKLHKSDWEANAKKIEKIIPPTVPGLSGNYALVASGGLCAPLEPIYTMPNFATTARPVRDSLPSFQAARGGVNVPTATTIADITTAIDLITEDEDALGGTFATKSCQDLSCPAYTETAITVISHCREYGNLNAMAWPEKIAHENDLTMAAHARVAETYLLDRIKALSINVTNGAETLGALIYLVDGIVKAASGMRYRLRMSPDSRFRALLPAWLPDLLVLDTVQTTFERFQSRAQLIAYLRQVGIEPTFYLDNVTGAVPFAAEAAGAMDGFPDTVQWAIFAEGAFLHIDSGSLELGLVRDSTLNSTNDHQIFGESFENVARIGPAQSALWVTSDLCASGQFPPAGTARTCD